jgi:hypothetical protein
MTLAGHARRQSVAPIRELEFEAPVTGITFLARGTLAVGFGDGLVRLFVPDRGLVVSSPHREGAAVLALVADLRRSRAPR